MSPCSARPFRLVRASPSTSLILGALVLAACTAKSETKTAAADFSAPALLAVTPSAGADLSAAEGAITATFDEALDCGSVDGNGFQLFEEGLPVPGYATCAGSTVTFHPLPSTPTDTFLMAFVTPAIADLAGNRISEYGWSFGVRPWTRQLGTASDDLAYGVATDGAGDVFVTGSTLGALDGQANEGLEDIFLAKYDVNGARLWTRQLGTVGQDVARGVATDGAGNAFVAGSTLGALDGQASAGAADLFLTKFDTTGSRLWTRQLGTAGEDVALGVATDGEGNVFVTGYTDGALDGQASAGAFDGFVTKYGADGVNLWTRQFGTTSNEVTFGVATDGVGNVVVVGYTVGVLDGPANAGSSDVFVIKYDASGAMLWTRQFGTAADDWAHGVATDGAGNVFVAGYTVGALDGQPSAGNWDAFVSKYSANGTRQWTRQLGTAVNDLAYGVATDGAGNAFVAGYTLGALDGQSSAGGTDLFVAKYDMNGARQWTRQRGTEGGDNGSSVATDGAGNVFVAGTTWGGFDGQTSAGGLDSFVVKYESDGRKR